MDFHFYLRVLRIILMDFQVWGGGAHWSRANFFPCTQNSSHLLDWCTVCLCIGWPQTSYSQPCWQTYITALRRSLFYGNAVLQGNSETVLWVLGKFHWTPAHLKVYTLSTSVEGKEVGERGTDRVRVAQGEAGTRRDQERQLFLSPNGVAVAIETCFPWLSIRNISAGKFS